MRPTVSISLTNARYALALMETDWPNYEPNSVYGSAIDRLREKVQSWDGGKVVLDEGTYNIINCTIMEIRLSLGDDFTKS